MDNLAVAQILSTAQRIFTITYLCLKLDKIHDNPNSKQRVPLAPRFKTADEGWILAQTRRTVAKFIVGWGGGGG